MDVEKKRAISGTVFILFLANTLHEYSFLFLVLSLVYVVRNANNPFTALVKFIFRGI